MEFKNFWQMKKQTIAVITIIVLVLGSVYTFTKPFKYGARSQVLVIQDGASGVDPFAVSRSVEYLSSLLSKVVYSNSFFNMTMNSGFDIEKDYFQGDSIKQMKTWQKTVSAKSLENSGMINITVYHSSPYQAKQIALAVNQVLMTQNSNYQGLGSSVRVIVTDEPVVSRYPIYPNIPLNLGLSLIFGLALGFLYAYLLPDEKHNIYLKKKRKVVVKGPSVSQNFAPTNFKSAYYPPEDPEAENTYNPENKGNINNILS
jgi:capsular polysaccharide biosynthesis protein